MYKKNKNQDMEYNMLKTNTCIGIQVLMLLGSSNDILYTL